MSGPASTWAWKQRAGGAKLVLCALANYADSSGFAYPGCALLAAMTERDERTVTRQLAELEKLGLIKRDMLRDKGQFTLHGFQLNIPAEELRAFPKPRRSGKAPPPSDKMSDGGGPSPSDKMSDGGGPSPSDKPSDKPSDIYDTRTIYDEPKILEPLRAREAGAAPGAPASALGEGEAGEAQPIPAEIAARLVRLLAKGEAEFRSWFRDCRWEAGRRRLIAPSRFHADYVRQQYPSVLREAFDGPVEAAAAGGG